MLAFQCSSASRKFLNAIRNSNPYPPPLRFQCSSASRKFLNSTCVICASDRPRSFSALQRAENSSIERDVAGVADQHPFQCSSASRKFLNITQRIVCAVGDTFQCSSASRKFLNRPRRPRPRENLQFVSVLFSEPKIPQCYYRLALAVCAPQFQCSSASRKFLNWTRKTRDVRGSNPFQCSSASRKFLNKIECCDTAGDRTTFQCSSASRKFLNRYRVVNTFDDAFVSVLFSEPKIPQ